MECGVNLWYFTHCPSCQCNGHSKCEDELTCGECSGNISGANCDKCKPGYWGSPIQGGICQPCECNNKVSSITFAILFKLI
jgi:attractin